jgi:hypothetical protein
MNLFNDPMKALLSTVDKLEAKVAERKKLRANKQAGLDAARLNVGEAADRALDKGDVAAYEALVASIAKQEHELEVIDASIEHAEKRVLEGKQEIFKQKHNEFMRNFSRIEKQMDKAAQAVQANGIAWAGSVKTFRNVTHQMLTLIVNATGRIPKDALLVPAEQNEAIGRMLLQAAPFSGIGNPEEHLVPGAIFRAYGGNPLEWPTFIQEVRKRLEYLTRLIEGGPELAQPTQGPEVQAPSTAPVVKVEHEPDAEEGRKYSLAEATANMRRPRIDLSTL